MAQWMETKRRWDGAIAKRAKLGRTLTPKDMDSYTAFQNSTKKVVLDTVNKSHVPQPAKATAAVLRRSLVAEMKLALDPAHLQIRFNGGPFYHLFVKEFKIAEAPAATSTLDAETMPGPESMPADDDEPAAADLSDHESEFEEVGPELAEACAGFVHGTCHEGDVD